MKALKYIYNQIGFIFAVVVIYLLYTQKIELNWYTGVLIILVVIVILALGKLLPPKK